MTDILSYVLTPAFLAFAFPKAISLYKQYQLRKTAKMLLKNGVKHAKVTYDQILFKTN